jgi:hypothetical protein
MYGLAMSTPQQFGLSIAVRNEQDLAYLIKESEMLTQQPGCEFQLRVGSQVLKYRVSFDGFAYTVAGFSPGNNPVAATILPQEMETSEFGIAMKEYRLFCDPLEERKPCRCKRKASIPAQ